MAAFNYVAKNSAGELVRASLEARNRLDALASLRKEGLTVVDLFSPDEDAKRIQKQTAKIRPVGKKMVSSVRITLAEMSLFCRLLATSVSAGVPLRESLESIEEDVENRALAKVLRGMVAELHEGRTFSETLANHPRMFSSLFISLIRSAEESGSMAQTLEHLAFYLERSEKLRRKIQSITAYPIFVAVFFFIVCAIMTLVIIPKFQEIFAEFDARLPAFTTLVFTVNSFLLAHIGWIALGLLVLVIAHLLYRRTRMGRYHIDRIKLNMPFVGNWIRKYAIARLCRNLAIMLKGGVPITTAFEISSGVTGNRVLQRSILSARDRVIAGSDISSSLKQDEQFPRLFIRMVNVGESSGQLPQVLEKLSDVYEDQVEGQVMVATALFEPLIIIFFGGFVLALVLAIYLPIFTVAQNVR